MPWALLLAIAAGFIIKWLVTNPAAKEVLYTSFAALRGKIQEINADKSRSLKDKIAEWFDMFRSR